MELYEQEFYKDFANETFDVKGYVANCMRTSDMSDQMTKLSEGIDVVENEIRKQVENKCEQLLGALSNLEVVEGFVKTMEQRLGGIQDSAVRLCEKIDNPYEKLSHKVDYLEKVQQTCETLRCCVRVMTLSKRLDGYMAQGSKELARAAQTLSELEYLLAFPDLADIDVIEKERSSFNKNREQVIQFGKTSLIQGLESENASQVAMSLQVFYLLGCLDKHVITYLDEVMTNLRSDADQWFDQSTLTALSKGQQKTSGPGRVTSLPAPGSAASYRAKLWSSVDKFFTAFSSVCQQVENLYKVLSKKKDATTEQTYLDSIKNYHDNDIYPLKVTTFISNMTTLLMDILERVASQSTHARQAFEAEYPKLLKMMTSCSNQCKGLMELASLDSEDNSLEQIQLFAAAVAPFETAYLSRSLSVLFDPVELMFPENISNTRLHGNHGNTLPDAADLANIIRLIQSELSVVIFDSNLCSKVSRNVSKAVNLLLVRVERIIATGSDASQIVGPLSPAQLMNAGIADMLINLETSLGHIMSNLALPKEATTKIEDVKKATAALAVTTMTPLLDSLTDALSAILESMHSEEFEISEDNSDSRSPSGYAKELCSFLKRISSEYLSCFKNKQLQTVCMDKLTTFCVESWLYNSCLVKPINNGGLQKLTTDWKHLKSHGLVASGFIPQSSESHPITKLRCVFVVDKLR